MKSKRLARKFLKFTTYFIGSLLVLSVGFHIWFIHRAKELICEMVEKKSNGKLKLNIGHLSYNYFTREMKFRNAVFYSTDSATASTAYRFDVKEIHVRLQGLLPFVLHKKLLIDSINLQSPDIRVTTLRYNQRNTKKSNHDISIPFEMGKIYKSIQDALQELKVEKFQIDNGQFSLLNKVSPNQQPFYVNRIKFHIYNLRIGGTPFSANEKILFSENVVLNTDHQDIIFPDGRHRLSFREFDINLKNQQVEFDSCTISGNKTDSSNASFSVFFDKLKLSNIDFDTLYKNEVIKADTVICLNPRFTLRANLTAKKDSRQKRPKLEKLIEQLTGDLLLGYVRVNNASFDITTLRNGRPSSFNSSENNFEMTGLTINQGAPKPVKVEGFAMAIRNYENFIRDSSYRVQFDSVLFRDNQISLNNFLFNRIDRGKIINTFSIPRFYLGGLSWDDLVFEKKLIAEQATLFNPNIHYTLNDQADHRGKNQDIFQSLAKINDFMDLKSLNIVGGKIDIRINKALQVNLEHANVNIKSHALLHANNMASVKNSINTLDFDKGTIKASDITVDLQHVHYAGENGQLKAGIIIFHDQDNNLYVLTKNAAIEKMQANEKTGDLRAEGISWQEADIRLHIGKQGNQDMKSLLDLQDVKGQQTRLFLYSPDKTTISTLLDNISFERLEKKPGEKLAIKKLVAGGSDFFMKNPDLRINLGNYQFTDEQASRADHGLLSVQKNNQPTLSMTIHSLTFTPHLSSLLGGVFHFENVILDKPVTEIFQSGEMNAGYNKKKPFPDIALKPLRVNQPVIRYGNRTDSTRFLFDWEGSINPECFIAMDECRTGVQGQPEFTARQLKFFLADATLHLPGGKYFSTNTGKLELFAEQANARKIHDDIWDWSIKINSLAENKINLDGKTLKGFGWKIDQFRLANLNMSSEFIKTKDWYIRENPELQISELYGTYTDSSNFWRWYNAGFDKGSGFLSADSMQFRPLAGRDQFIANHPYESDFITVRTGNIQMDHIHADAYVLEGLFKAGTLTVHDMILEDYRDKRLPDQIKKYKPLPTALLRNMPFKIYMDTVKLEKATVLYTEFNDKTNAPGTIPLYRLQASAFPVKNTGLSATDSFHVYAEAYIMDSLYTRLSYASSYADSLCGFTETLHMQGRDLMLLNPVIVPLSSIKLRSARLDTMMMFVSGNDELAYGTMNLFYHHLKVKLLKNGSENNRGILKSLETFFANSFFIKNNNERRTGRVFFIRMKDRSALQYLVKTFFSGISSSIGAKNNRKKMRRYNKELRRQHALPVDFNE